MANFTITDFKWGMDRRRERTAGIPGTLWVGKNVHISRGGDVQRAKKFVPTYALPADTFGLGQLRGQLFVFGSAVAPTLPVGLQYQRLQAADTTSSMVELLDVDTFDGAFYVIARFNNGNIHHFYDGSRVTDWDTLAAAATDVETLATYLADLIDADADVSATAVGNVLTIQARVAGKEFTIIKTTTDFGGVSDQDITLGTEQANVSETEETQATTIVGVVGGSVGTIQDITINSVSLMWAPVTWATSHSVTAAAIAVQINNKTATHGYVAEVSGPNITLTAGVGTGSTPNNQAVASSVTGDVQLTTPSMGGGVAAVDAVAQITTATLSGTLEATDLYTLIINDISYSASAAAAATGSSAFIHKKRMWSPANSLWNYSKLTAANDWIDSNVSSGAGFINIASESEGRERLVGAAPYGTQAAVFSRNSVHIYNLSTDAEDFAVAQPLGNTGALAARAILPFGNLDVFYLDEPGIRSLKARDNTGEAYASDIGNPIDPFVRDYLDSLSEAQIRRAVSVIGPEGRFWMAVGERIFVLSYFPGSNIAAWSYYEPGFEVRDFARVHNKTYARAEDTIYLYGGADGTVYPSDDDALEAEVSTAFFTAQAPATIKKLTGFDIACTGQWSTDLLLNPNDENQFVNVGELTRTTYNNPHGQIKIPGETSHMALSFICTKGGAASISSITVHFEAEETG